MPDTVFLDSPNPVRYNSGYPGLGPVAQLGARFNRTEEVGGSNPPRSTGFLRAVRAVICDILVFAKFQGP